VTPPEPLDAAAMRFEVRVCLCRFSPCSRITVQGIHTSWHRSPGWPKHAMARLHYHALVRNLPVKLRFPICTPFQRRMS
jgi:hypothetical protein